MENGSVIYIRRQQWKGALFAIAVIIGVASIFYAHNLASRLAAEERKKFELWAEATRVLIKADLNNGQDLSFVWKVIENNTSVPVILTDENDTIISTRNLDSSKLNNNRYLERQLRLMKSENEPIVIELGEGMKNLIYYRHSKILTALVYYPYIQMAVIIFFIFISYLTFNSTREAEQNMVWVGMAKETAHQLGTPISSLIAWVQLMKEKADDSKVIDELEKDVSRLEKITERFSKIGSAPKLQPENIIRVIYESVDYLRSRIPEAVSFIFNYSNQDELLIPLNAALFEWVIENLVKNAVDAMKGKGKIEISIFDHVQVIYLDIRDTGKGISKSKYKTIFRPGYTTKPRGWGLGLTLTKRIVESYHKGKIFVNESGINTGTTIRIVLKKF